MAGSALVRIQGEGWDIMTTTCISGEEGITGIQDGDRTSMGTESFLWTMNNGFT